MRSSVADQVAEPGKFSLASDGVFYCVVVLTPSLIGWLVAGRNRQCGVGLSHAFMQGNRSANDHEKIVGVRAFVGHHELEMDAEELPAEQVVVFGFDDFTEPDRHDGRVAPGGAGIDAVAGDRIERKEVHHILARLAVDPVDRRLEREFAQMIAEIL